VNEARAAALRAVWQAGRAAWPALSLDAERFAAWLDARLAPEDDPAALVAADVYLVAACLLGVPGAAEAFIAGPLERARPTLARRLKDTHAIDELMQDLAVHLLAPGDGGKAPRLSTFAGRGALVVWLRMVAARLAINQVTRRPDPVDLDRLEEDLASEHDVELSALRLRHRPLMHDVFRAAIADTPEEERLLLKLHYAQGSTLNELAAIHHTSRSAMHRRLEAARADLLTRVAALLDQRLGIGDDDRKSMLAVFRSALREELRALWRSGGGPDDR